MSIRPFKLIVRYNSYVDALEEYLLDRLDRSTQTSGPLVFARW
jgi:hypothetical protein